MSPDELRALSDEDLEQERRKSWYVRNVHYPRVMSEVWRRIEIVTGRRYSEKNEKQEASK